MITRSSGLLTYVSFGFSCFPFSVKACTDMETRIYMKMEVGRRTYSVISLLNVSCNLWRAVYIIQKNEQFKSAGSEITNTGFIFGIE